MMHVFTGLIVPTVEKALVILYPSVKPELPSREKPLACGMILYEILVFLKIEENRDWFS
jgi:hypothetical protein